MSLPTYLEADLVAYDRGDMSEDFDRVMEFFAGLIRVGDIPYRVNSRVRGAISKGYLSAAGDVLTTTADDTYDGGGWHVSELDS